MPDEIVVINPTPVSVGVYTGQPGPQGVRGLQGIQGPKGDKGDQGDVPTIGYIHTQNAVSSTWSITHNLGFYPNVLTQDSAGTTIEGTVTFPSSSTVTITFSVATSGVAYLS